MLWPCISNIMIRSSQPILVPTHYPAKGCRPCHAQQRAVIAHLQPTSWCYRRSAQVEMIKWLILALFFTACSSYLLNKPASSSYFFSSSSSSISPLLLSKADADLILERAVTKRDVDRNIVIDCMSKIKGNKVKADDVLGRWEACFSSVPGGAAEGFLVGAVYDNAYFAIKEVISFESNFESIELNTPIGSFKGLAGISNQSPLTVEYEFEKFLPLNIPLLAQEVPINRRSYSFIYLKNGIAVCRTSSSALTLLTKL